MKDWPLDKLVDYLAEDMLRAFLNGNFKGMRSLVKTMALTVLLWKSEQEPK